MLVHFLVDPVSASADHWLGDRVEIRFAGDARPDLVCIAQGGGGEKVSFFVAGFSYANEWALFQIPIDTSVSNEVALNCYSVSVTA